MGKKSCAKKQRKLTTTTFLDMGVPVALNKVRFGTDGSLVVGSVAGQEKPVASHVETTYERPKGPKIIHKITVPPQDLTINPNIALTRYAWVFAVDTNKPLANLPNVVFMGVVLSKVLMQPGQSFVVEIYSERVVELHNLSLPTERFGWFFVCSSITNLPKDVLVAVIVDSELSNIPLINKRKEPITDDFYLPEHFELLYASSDTGGGFIANNLLKRCDRNTREIAKIIATTQASSLPPLLNASPDDPFTHIRIWEQSLRKPEVI